MHNPLYLLLSFASKIFSPGWQLTSYLLRQNPNKTEFLLFICKNINPPAININHDLDIILLSYSAENLGVLFQSDISLNNHISSIIKSYFVQLRDFRRIRLLMFKTAAITLATSFVYSHLDY